MRREVLKTLNSATGLTESDPQWLWTLKLRGADALNKKTIARAFIEAAQSNSDLWSKSEKAVDSPFNDALLLQNRKVPWRLLECWSASSGSPYQFSFYYYNDKALAKLIDFQFNYAQGHYSEVSIHQIWKRLGLTKSRRLLFRDIRIEDGMAFPVPYKVVQRPV